MSETPGRRENVKNRRCVPPFGDLMSYNMCMISQPEDLLCPVWLVVRRANDLVHLGDVSCDRICQ